MLLLVVLALLMLFSMVAVTFVLLSSRHLETTRYAVKNEQTGNNPRQLLDEVFAQLVRGSNNPFSVIGPHGLLEDLYGNDGITYRNTTPMGATAVAGGQILDLTFTPAPCPAPTATPPATAILYANFPGTAICNAYDPNRPLTGILTQTELQTPGYFNGAVLTAIGGAAHNRSTRVLGWAHSAGSYRIRILNFEGMTSAAVAGDPPLGFVINGRPFNGTGFGFNPTAAFSADSLLDAAQTITLPDGFTQVSAFRALLPNPVFFDGQSARAPDSGGNSLNVTPPGTDYPVFGGLGGADEDYDAADPQNMILAEVPLNPLSGGAALPLIPSFHRPEAQLYTDAVNAGKYSGSIEGILSRRLIERQSMLRPAPADHPQFPRLTNPAVFDVDNDGDGITDSIWVDAGLPVRMAPDGRTYKPLVAVLCMDLDGRLNVNAHGSTAHVDEYLLTTDQPMSDASILVGQFTTSPFRDLARGQGYGPAEISLFPLFQPLNTTAAPATVLAPYVHLLAARYSEPNTNFYDLVRDGTTITPVYSSAPTFTAAAGQKLGPLPGASLFADRMAGLKFTHLPVEDYLSSYRSPPDMKGRGFVAVDSRGMPVHLYQQKYRDRIDNPYEFNVMTKPGASNSPTSVATAITAVNAETTPNPLDSPFTAGELERILRIYDLDSTGLPDRLRSILTSGGGPALSALRGMITTHSFDLPSPAIIPTRDMRQQAATLNVPLYSPAISDLLRLRMQAATFAGNIEAEIQKMLSPELVGGLRIDLNRPFGNGRDDSAAGDPGYGIVDEPREVETAIWSAMTMSVPVAFTSTAIPPNLINGMFDLGGDNVIDNTENRYARQLYARYLYVLMMMLKDSGAQYDADGDGNVSDEETANAIAQWAVNVVDFRDQDSIMTPFVYNVDPFTAGWTAPLDPPATPIPGVNVVWGCERPELLITETLAFHDRRTEDLDTDNDTGKKTTALMDPDDDFDQRVPPRGSLFIEIYNPWVNQSATLNPDGLPSAHDAPGEFYNLDLVADTARGVNLNATDKETGATPVWRMAVTDGTATYVANGVATPADLNHFVPAQRPTIERSIYFVQPPATITDDGQKYFSNLGVAPLLPGRYGVVGSAGVQNGGNYITTLGRRTDASIDSQDGATDAAVSTTRRIILSPNPDPNVAQVQLPSNGDLQPTATNVQPAIAAVINQSFDNSGNPVPRSISVSEPYTGYSSAVAAPPAEPVVLSPSEDTPFDNANTQLPPPGTTPQWKFVHLQRLADPTRAYDQHTNPYLTIDSAPISITHFNGLATDPYFNSATYTGITSTERGVNAADLNRTLWQFQPALTGTNDSAYLTSPADNPAVHYLPFQLRHTLGYINSKFGDARTGTGISTADTPYPSYTGSPNIQPFEWLTWNDRPYANGLELLLVPKSRSSRLTIEYRKPVTQPFTATPVPSGHLLPFFETVAPTVGQLQNFQRVLDYVRVPTPFVGAELELTPSYFAPPTLPAIDTTTFGATNTETALMSFLHPPFNRVPAYREPGRININTIPSDMVSASSSVWNGVLNQPATDAVGPNWGNLFLSRQGTSSVFAPGSAPSRISNPFRSSAGESLRLPVNPPVTKREEVDVTLLRRSDPDSTLAPDSPLFNNASAKAFNNPASHHYFGSQTLRRLGGSTTTRSNVYAMWITVGYFEVRPPVDGAGVSLPSGPNTPYPDGYQLFGEMGSDTGEIKRHRAFYIYDRSIPVAFERGKDHNMADGILLKRFIE